MSTHFLIKVNLLARSIGLRQVRGMTRNFVITLESSHCLARWIPVWERTETTKCASIRILPMQGSVSFISWVKVPKMQEVHSETCSKIFASNFNPLTYLYLCQPWTTKTSTAQPETAGPWTPKQTPPPIKNSSNYWVWWWASPPEQVQHSISTLLQ
jgi:hypothetical protein